MRVQKVNEHTIRIFISLTELSDRDITMTDLFQRSAKTEQLFWELIAQAREEVEFNLDQPFWIQATVATNDEFVITIMKQEDQVEGSVKEKAGRKTPKGRVTELVYVFADLEDVISAVARLPEFAQLRSGLYEFEKEYYLVLNRMGTGKKRFLAEAILDEYGEIVGTTGVFLSEHGKGIILEKAVQTLNAAFNKSTQS
ncbi:MULTISPECIES: adaptor protein MecA [Desulfosporosinus]|uniref:Adapter protein MecA 1/2 n=2 Tax=Desulfosporosinus TaxID=79206 RepID=A0A1M5URP0_9FIRM|nr:MULTISPECIES: adaptor protein MecA [Desulfosporosinus]MDA8223886.1 adaptor protein MecA [Desulfitobacterium hafniense]MCO1601278.1 adaptor protein MecA [Desulfosporosinus nitroreducens]MCO5385576.1 adaptor protein MecA [Desulfosporosinus sp.]MDO0821779.1 adaptor protein MecA [Desulfosporosinus nitroreducens]SHH65585.1 adapter protein MecA 1/2 [Desulfosporosinus lacus DSM 15449]